MNSLVGDVQRARGRAQQLTRELTAGTAQAKQALERVNAAKARMDELHRELGEREVRVRRQIDALSRAEARNKKRV